MKDDKVYLAHIQDAITRILSYTGGGRGEFVKNPMVQDAVVRNLEIIREAAKNISDATKARRPAIPWRRIVRTAGCLDSRLHGGGPGRGLACRRIPPAFTA